jgi:hypothetical protein
VVRPVRRRVSCRPLAVGSEAGRRAQSALSGMPPHRRTYAAGIVTIRGSLAVRCKDEIIALARHAEAAEKPGHPMNRIAAIEQSEEGLVITTTDIHLPRRIGEAIKEACHARLDIQFNAEEYFVRIFLD